MKATKRRTTKNTRVFEVCLPDRDEPLTMRLRRPDGWYITPGFFFANKAGLTDSLERVRQEICRTINCCKYPPRVTLIVQCLRHGRRAYGIASDHYSPVDLEYLVRPPVVEEWKSVLLDD